MTPMLTRKILTGLSVLLAGTGVVHASSHVGEASFYAGKGRSTADGGHVGSHTAASPTLPLESKARVTNLKNNRSVDVTVNDRGPYVGGRIIDVSPDAAKDLGFRDAGKAPVKVEALPKAEPSR